MVEPWRIVHGDLGAESAVTQIGPVAHFTVADADEVGEAIAGQIGEVDRSVRSAKTRRGPSSRRATGGLLGRTESRFRQRRVPEGFVFGDQNVGIAVAG